LHVWGVGEFECGVGGRSEVIHNHFETWVTQSAAITIIATNESDQLFLSLVYNGNLPIYIEFNELKIPLKQEPKEVVLVVTRNS
jgi:hypothetical protein